MINIRDKHGIKLGYNFKDRTVYLIIAIFHFEFSRRRARFSIFFDNSPEILRESRQSRITGDTFGNSTRHFDISGSRVSLLITYVTILRQII